MKSALRICLLLTLSVTTSSICYQLGSDDNYRSLASVQEERKESVSISISTSDEEEFVDTLNHSEEGKKTIAEVEAEMIAAAKEEAKKQLDKANEDKIKAEKILAEAKQKKEEAEKILLVVDEEYDCSTCELEQNVDDLLKKVAELTQINESLMSELAISNPFTASGFMGYQDFYNTYGNYLYNSFAPNGVQQQPYNGLQQPKFNNTFTLSQLSGYGMDYASYPGSNSQGAYGRFQYEPVLTPDFNYNEFLGIGVEQNLFYGRSNAINGFSFGNPPLLAPQAPPIQSDGYNYMSA